MCMSHDATPQENTLPRSVLVSFATRQFCHLSGVPEQINNLQGELINELQGESVSSAYFHGHSHFLLGS